MSLRLKAAVADVAEGVPFATFSERLDLAEMGPAAIARATPMMPTLLAKLDLTWQQYTVSFAMCITVVLAVFIWSGAVIWSLWRAAWIRGALIGIASITALLISSRAVAGAQPVAYGITLGLSLFLGSAMVVMGIIAQSIRALARIDGE